MYVHPCRPNLRHFLYVAQCNFAGGEEVEEDVCGTALDGLSTFVLGEGHGAAAEDFARAFLAQLELGTDGADFGGGEQTVDRTVKVLAFGSGHVQVAGMEETLAAGETVLPGLLVCMAETAVFGGYLADFLNKLAAQTLLIRYWLASSVRTSSVPFFHSSDSLISAVSFHTTA